MEALTITREQWQAMLAHVRAGRPEEACGLLAGSDGQVRRVYPLENAAHSPVEYRLDPGEQVRVMLEIEALGWEMCGIFHSHPNGPPAPSETDVRQAYYPEAVYLIFAPDEDGRWQGRGFRIQAGRVREVALKLE